MRRTFYNGATEQERATPLAVKKGAHLTADLHLNPMPALTVTVKVPVESRAECLESWPILQKMDFDRPERCRGGDGRRAVCRARW